MVPTDVNIYVIKKGPTVWQKPNLANFEPILPDRYPEQPKQILQSDWSKNIRERLVLVSLGRKIDFRKPVMLSPVELRLRRGCRAICRTGWIGLGWLS